MQIAAGEFKTRCLSLMEEVRQHHRTITITKRGKPVARLVPADDAVAPALFGLLKGHALISGDIVAPTGETWNADA